MTQEKKKQEKKKKSKKKEKQVPKAFVCYEITPHEWPSIHTVHQVHVSLTTKANKKAMSAADEWIRHWNNTEESIKTFLEVQSSPRYYFKEFELGKDFFLYNDDNDAAAVGSQPSITRAAAAIILPKKEEENIIETSPKKVYYSPLTDFAFPTTP